jgi:choline dehydrogenase-like flavoprotein
VEAGYPFTEDMNGFQQEGFGYMDMTVHKVLPWVLMALTCQRSFPRLCEIMLNPPLHLSAQGQRWSAASAYLRPALDRPNLQVMTSTLTHRVLLQGNRAIGQYTRKKKGARNHLLPSTPNATRMPLGVDQVWRHRGLMQAVPNSSTQTMSSSPVVP